MDCSIEPGWRKDGNFCVHEVEDQRCSLDFAGAAYKGKTINSCYAVDGIPQFPKIPAPKVPAPEAPSRERSTLSATCARLAPLGETSGGEPQLIVDIRQLQTEESGLLSQLRSAGTSTNTSDTSVISLKLDNVRKTRMVLLKQLSSVYTSSQCNLSSDRIALRDQIAMIELAEQQLTNIKENIASLRINRDNRQRMVEINNYEYDRYASHTSLFRVVAICGLFVLGGLLLANRGQSFLGRSIIVLALAVLVVIIIHRLWLNWWRDPMNWDEFEWIDRPGRVGYETVWEHNKKLFKKGWGGHWQWVPDGTTDSGGKKGQSMNGAPF